MKLNSKVLLLILFFTIPVLVLAQSKVKGDATEGRLFVGVTATTIGYNLEYRQEPKGGDIQTYGSINLGYKLSERARVGVGVSYGTDKYNFATTFVESEDRLVHRNEIAKTKGVSVPLTLDYTLFYPFRRFRVYGTAMLTPIYSVTKMEKLERIDDVTTVTYQAKASGINVYLTGGVGFGFPISRRLDVYGNYYFISRSFNRNLRRKDEHPYPGALAVGINYSL